MGIVNMKVRRQVASTLRKLLETNKWSEAELARITQSFNRPGDEDHAISQKHVNNVMRERTSLSVESLHSFAKAMQIPAWQLLIPGRANSSASPRKLERVVIAYLNGDDALRAVFDRLTDTENK